MGISKENTPLIHAPPALPALLTGEGRQFYDAAPGIGSHSCTYSNSSSNYNELQKIRSFFWLLRLVSE